MVLWSVLRPLLWERYFENGFMNTAHLQRFLIEVQKQERATAAEAQAIIDGLKHLNIFHRGGLYLDGFFKYLFSDANLLLSPSLGVHHVCIEMLRTLKQKAGCCFGNCVVVILLTVAVAFRRSVAGLDLSSAARMSLLLLHL
ncbi:hypothetical protein K1719_045552 [Acacia pycnantha]|nr:hypothetical protein K1719_045552 [Acacia pycnantha]